MRCCSPGPLIASLRKLAPRRRREMALAVSYPRLCGTVRTERTVVERIFDLRRTSSSTRLCRDVCNPRRCKHFRRQREVQSEDPTAPSRSQAQARKTSATPPSFLRNGRKGLGMDWHQRIILPACSTRAQRARREGEAGGKPRTLQPRPEAMRARCEDAGIPWGRAAGGCGHHLDADRRPLDAQRAR